MPTEFFLIAVIILIAFAIFDLMVGVSNDAANFLNSSIGSKVAPRTVIMIIASLGILVGVTFSSGMMEVARKGIFHPQLFTMPELLMIFLAVMLTDIVLLDVFNTFGLPTSTTVSIVFELLGGAVAISIFKIFSKNGSLLSLGNYINTDKAMMIIFGILMAIVAAFICGAITQFFARLIFTFDYVKRLNRYGALWGGFAMSIIFYFILIKGAKGASWLSPESYLYIKSNAWIIIFIAFLASTIIFQILLFLKFNILKPLILIGTFALAMAFAANDLVNFIGVPLAGLTSYQVGIASGAPLTETMDALAKKVPTNTYLLVIAGLIMVVTLWISKKARTVSSTEIGLGSQDEGIEKFESVGLSRIIVRMTLQFFGFVKVFSPPSVRNWVSNRFDAEQAQIRTTAGEAPRFDLLRASVNLMVASAVISYATSQKLPLSTTYVTFTTAMGTSFADRAWGRESAVYRITGVLTVIGGWFMTAISAFVLSFIIAITICYTNFYVVPVLLIVIGFIIFSNHKKHGERVSIEDDEKIFNLKKITDTKASIATTFEHLAILTSELRKSLDNAMSGLFRQDSSALRAESKKAKTIQTWTNIIIANIFKSMRLLQKNDVQISAQYAKIVRRLQNLSDCHRDLVIRAKLHVDNQHKGLISEQVEELQKIRPLISSILKEMETTFNKQQTINYNSVLSKTKELAALADELNQKQVSRIVSRESKTRLSILFYATLEDTTRMAKQSLKLMKVFEETFGEIKNEPV